MKTVGNENKDSFALINRYFHVKLSPFVDCFLHLFYCFQGKVIRTKSTSSISFPLSFMVVLVSVSWLSYGLLLGDIYVQVSRNVL